MKKNPVILAALASIPFLVWIVFSIVDLIPLGSPMAGKGPSLEYRLFLTLFLSLILTAPLFLVFRFTRRASDDEPSGDPFFTLVEAAPDCIVVHRQNHVVYANQRTLDFFGVTNYQDFQDHDILGFVHPKYQDLILQRQAEIIQTRQPSDMLEATLVMLNGSTREVALSSTIIEFQGEDSLLTFIRDVSEQRSTRQELLDSRERLQLALEASQDGVWDWDITTGEMIYNQTWAQMLGFELDELMGDESAWLYLIHPDDHGRSNALLEAHLRGDLPKYETEVRLRHKSGHYIWVLDRGRVVAWDDQGVPLRMTGTHRDITARKEAELALEIRNRIAEVFLVGQDQNKYALLLENIVRGCECCLGVFATCEDDGSLKVWAVHPDEGEKRTPQAFKRIPAAEVPPFLQPVLESQKSLILDGPHFLQSIGQEFQAGLVVPITYQENVIGLILLGNKAQGFLDSDRTLVESLAGYMAPILQSHLTSEMREAQLRQAQKMEALGALAGGLAHDFNNILQAIMGFTTLARDEAPVDGLIAGDLERVIKASRRGQDLVQRILLFSRREEQEQFAVPIREIVAEAVDLLNPSIPATIEIRADLPDGCGRVLADPSQINQVIMNLATNAFHAMEADGGVLEIGLRLVNGQEVDQDLPESLKEGTVVMLWVSDTGIGIDPEEMDRVFDPFFTTKEVGKGTGLGLSVVHGIVINHGGEVILDSKTGRGTMVRVFLPSLETSAKIGQNGETGCASLPAAKAGAHIMFVDDEEDIATIGKAMLEKQGFKVTTFTEGSPALAQIQEEPEKYDLVITDLTMPQMTGLHLADAVAKVRQNLPVILITGLGEDQDRQLEKHPHIQGIVHKPFGLEALCNIIYKVMTDNPNGAH